MRGKVCILLDDMIDTAGTLCAGGVSLMDHGATRVFACATHPVFSGPALERLDASVFENVVVTDTIPINPLHKPDKVQVLSVAQFWLIPSATSSTTTPSPGCSTAGTSSSSPRRSNGTDSGEGCMERAKIEARVREGRGTKDAKALRAVGDIPGVIYSATSDTEAIVLSARDLRHALSGAGMHAVFDLSIDGKKTRPVLIKEFQLDAVRDRVIHVDLHEIRLDQKINTSITVHLEGHAEGVNMGGALSQPTHEVHVEALPADLVESITVDVSALEIGQSIRLSDLTPPNGITFTDDLEGTILATIAAPVSDDELKSEAELEAEGVAEGEGEGAEGEGGEEGGSEGGEESGAE